MSSRSSSRLSKKALLFTPGKHGHLLRKSRKVNFASNVNSNKMCDTGNFTFPKNTMPWAFYLTNYDKKVCDNGKYLKYNQSKGKYCCSDTPPTLDEMIDHCEYLLDMNRNFINDVPINNNKIIETNTNNITGKKAKNIMKKKQQLLDFEQFIKSKIILFEYWKSIHKT